MSSRRVLVTGGWGFVAGHCIRLLARADDARSSLHAAGLVDADALGHARRVSNDAAREVLGRHPGHSREAVAAAARSLAP